MKFPLSWLEDFMTVDKDIQTYVDTLNSIGFEVEGVEIPGKEISGVITVLIEGVTKHPDADKLNLVDIDTGKDKRTIVCGAPNVAVGLRVPYAPSGAELPGGFKLSKKEIRGIESDGMLCGAEELGMEAVLDRGLLVLGEDAEPGSDFVKYLGLDDPIIDLSITPNRPDAMNVIGIARELCAAFDQELKLPDTDKFLDGIKTDEKLTKAEATIEDEEKCPRFFGRTASVKVDPTPSWMVKRLEKAGMRSINNVVDVTNYVMLEMGRPVHAFDLDKLGTNHIVIRNAHDGEKLTTLDGVDRVLTSNDLVLAAKDGDALDVAGVMGGESSEITETTKNVYLTSAYFTPAPLSKTSKRLGLRSEASSRFERGVDPAIVVTGANRVLQLFVEHCGAVLSSSEVNLYPKEIKEGKVALRFDRVERILGMAITKEEIIKALTPLVVSISETKDGIEAVIPTSRPDLTREIDLIEEVARRVGYDKFESTIPAINSQVGGLNREQKIQRQLEDLLVGAGFHEAYTLPLEGLDTYAEYGFAETDLVKTKNALRSDASILRPRIMPGLFKSAQDNIAKGIVDLKLFEIGHVFNLPFDENLQPQETNHLCVVFAGGEDSRPTATKREYDVFDAMDVARSIFAALKIENVTFETMTHKGFHPTRTVKIMIDNVEVGFVAQKLGEEKLIGLELVLDLVYKRKQKTIMYEPLSNFPYLSFDLAFVVDKTVDVDTLQKSILKFGGSQIEEINCFDIFESDSLGEGKKSVAYALRIRSTDGTMSDEDQAKLRSQIINGVDKKLGAKLR